MDSVEVLINDRWPIRMPPHRAERPEWFFWEAARIASMNHYLKPGMTIFDIGAEEGDMPVLWASWGLDVVLVEPNPKVWPCIKLTWEINGFKPKGWYVGFVADKPWFTLDDTMVRLGSDGWPECAYGELIPAHGFQHIKEHAGVTPAMTIDQLTDTFGPPDAITMDVEGAEGFVLQGAARTLEEHRPLVWVSIHAEIMADLYGHDPSIVHDLMGAAGYDSQYLATDHEAHWQYIPR